MPEMHFSVRWPDNSTSDCYSPSRVIKNYLEVGKSYPLPEFVDRFGAAYKAELAAFIECCRTNQPFPATHRDGLRAQQVISAGMQHTLTPEQATPVT